MALGFKIPSPNSDNSNGQNQQDCDYDNRDRISNLPESILTKILSLIPFKESGRTSILSSQWRYLWTLSPLDHLDDLELFSIERHTNVVSRRLNAITSILSQHQGPIHSFRLSRPSWARHLSAVDNWIEILTRSGIRNLVLNLFIRKPKDHYLLPPCLLACESLRSLELRSIKFSELPQIPKGSFTNLTKLSLWAISYVTEDMISELLSGCQFLCTLKLQSLHLENVHISSSSLRFLKLNYVRCNKGYTNILIEDSPNLESLKLDYNATTVSNIMIVNTPKLQILGYVNARVYSLCLLGTCFQHGHLTNLSTRVHSIKKLAIMVDFSDVLQTDILADLLKCFPCLEELKVLQTDYRHSLYTTHHIVPVIKCWEQEGSFDCLNRHLRIVKLTRGLHRPYLIRFAKFLIQNAQVLERMTFVENCSGRPGDEEDLLEELCFETRVSLDAQVILEEW